MMLPELQDLADFDAPEFGQDLAFLGNDDSDERLYLEDLSSDLAKCSVKSGRSKQGCIRTARSVEARRKLAAKKKKKEQDFEKAVQAEVMTRSGGTSISKLARLARSKGKIPPKKAPLPIIRGKSSRRFPTPRPKATREEKIRGVVDRGIEEQRAQRAGVDPQHSRLAREDALNAISKRFRADIMPKLNAIYKMVDQGSLQTSATNEHNVIMNTQAYRRKVLNDIARISARLPKGHPLRNKMAARRRSLGLY